LFLLSGTTLQDDSLFTLVAVFSLLIKQDKSTLSVNDEVVQNKEQVQGNGHTPVPRMGEVVVERHKINYEKISKRKP
jgi:hypothetical protein